MCCTCRARTGCCGRCQFPSGSTGPETLAAGKDRNVVDVAKRVIARASDTTALHVHDAPEPVHTDAACHEASIARAFLPPTAVEGHVCHFPLRRPVGRLISAAIPTRTRISASCCVSAGLHLRSPSPYSLENRRLVLCRHGVACGLFAVRDHWSSWRL